MCGREGGGGVDIFWEHAIMSMTTNDDYLSWFFVSSICV